jgi:hypothetical protein
VTRSAGRAKLLLLNNDDVAKVLDMPLCLSALDAVFHEMAAGEAVGMGRIDVYVPSQEPAAPFYRWAVMTGKMVSRAFSGKVESGFPSENAITQKC